MRNKKGKHASELPGDLVIFKEPGTLCGSGIFLRGPVKQFPKRVRFYVVNKFDFSLENNDF